MEFPKNNYNNFIFSFSKVSHDQISSNTLICGQIRKNIKDKDKSSLKIIFIFLEFKEKKANTSLWNYKCIIHILAN